MDGIDHFPDVRFLERLDARIERKHLVVEDRGDPDPIDVVRGMERVALHIVWRRAEVESPTVEEHHCNVDALVRPRR